MKKVRWFIIIIGSIMFLLSLWQIQAASSGLEVIKVNKVDPPLTFISPVEADTDTRPLVLIGHGFSGSRVIMYGFALTFAHAGYNVALWDFDGHGANSEPLPLDPQRDSLIENAEDVLNEALARGLGDPAQVTILGHSMGSGAAIDYGVKHSQTAATVAVSPVRRTVTFKLPQNLLLMAGSSEPAFMQNAEDLLITAGGTGGDPTDGTARELVVIPGVEHVSILFAPQAHHAALGWLEATFGIQPGASAYTDRRILWYGLGLFGALTVIMGLAPLLVDPLTNIQPRTPLWRRVAALAVGVIGGTFVLWVLDLLGVQLQAFLGSLIGGYVLLWLGVVGVMCWLVLWQKPEGVTGRRTLAAIVIFAGLWVGVGLLGELVWLQWLLIPRRLFLWLIGSILLLPLFMALAEMVRGSGTLGRIGWWLVYSLLLAGGLVLVITLNPDLGVLGLILPLLPAVFGFHALAAGPYRHRWSFALSGALFLSWVIAAVFPLV
jgi:pimeloyl-ACP methyl ester carboxylesterase